MAKLIIYFCFLFFLIYAFFIFQTNFHGPDEPIYYAYTESIIEDGDFNVVNNIDRDSHLYFPSGVAEVSKTYNLPDFHGHGGVVLWAPFYVYAKFMYSMAIKFKMTKLIAYGPKRFIECLMSFSTIVFGFFILIITYIFCRNFFSDKISFFSTLVICFGTPFFYFLLFEVGNAQILASLLSVLSIWAISCVIGIKRSHWFVYGLFFGICIATKVDLWFQIFFILSFLMVNFVLKRMTWKNFGFFLFGVMPAYILKIINDYIKYGTFHMGEFGILNFKGSYFWEMLFSSYRGYFYTSPILYICLLGFILVAARSLRNVEILSGVKEIGGDKSRDLFIFILSSYLIIKIFIISYDYAWGGGTPGGRVLLTDFPVFVILYAYILQTQKGFRRYCLLVVSLIFILWNLLIISEYMIGVDLNYVLGMPSLSIRIKSFKNILISLFNYQDLKLKSYLCLFPILIISGITFYVIMFSKRVCFSFWDYKKIKNNQAFKVFCLFAIVLNFSYVYATFLNVYNNKNNVEKLKKDGVFKNAKILTPRDFEKNENSRAMDEMIEYFTLKGDQKRVYRIEKQKQESYGEN